MGGLGALFIALGIFLYLRDRDKTRREELEKEDAGAAGDPLEENPDEIMDAIITLDEQFRKAEVSSRVYEKRRSELKERLKTLL